MKIALATNDRKTISLRTGRAKEFGIYEIIDSKITNISFKKNNHKHDHDHGEEHKHSHREIIDLLLGIDLLVVRAIGKNFKHDVEDAKIKYRKVSIENIDDLMSEYLV